MMTIRWLVEIGALVPDAEHSESTPRPSGDPEATPSAEPADPGPLILVDADACPVKEETYRVAERYRLRVIVGSNVPIRLPKMGRVEPLVVPGGFNAVDDALAALAGPNVIVITADVPLAERCVDAGALVLDPRGRRLDAKSIGSAVATRNLLADLRTAGQITGGPAPFGPKDRSRFLQLLDESVNRLRRGR
jgi:hypothetical protein